MSKVPWKEMMDFEFADGQFDTPASGSWTTPSDIEGAILAGTADDIVDGVQAFFDAGANHLVFDLRARFADWDECVALLAEEVLPRVRPQPATAG
jgi:hypothetical protein